MDDDRDARPRRRRSAGSAPPGRSIQSPQPAIWDGEHLAPETISAILDDPRGFSRHDRESIEQHLAACDRCTGVREEMRSIVDALGRLPQFEAPRSFALTPDAAAPQQPIVLRETPQWLERRAAGIRRVAAIAAVLFIFVVSADLISNRPSGTVNDSAREVVPAAAQQNSRASSGAAPTATSGQVSVQAEETEQTLGAAAPAETSQTEAAVPAESATPAPSEGVASDTAATPQPSDSQSLTGDEFGTNQQPAPGAQDQSAHSAWRLIEVGLALLVGWLLAAIVLVRRGASPASPQQHTD